MRRGVVDEEESERPMRWDNFKFKLRGHMAVRSHGHCPQPTHPTYYRAICLVSLLLEKETKGFRSPSRVPVLYFLQFRFQSRFK